MHKQYTKILVKVVCKKKKLDVKIKLNRSTKNKHISKAQSDQTIVKKKKKARKEKKSC
jgi:hypothetical protein